MQENCKNNEMIVVSYTDFKNQLKWYAWVDNELKGLCNKIYTAWRPKVN